LIGNVDTPITHGLVLQAIDFRAHACNLKDRDHWSDVSKDFRSHLMGENSAENHREDSGAGEEKDNENSGQCRLIGRRHRPQAFNGSIHGVN